MFGYRDLRRLGYCPIAWQEIHNSLHSMPPEERLGSKRLDIIKKMTHKGVTTHEATSEADVLRFHALLRNFYRFKLRRFIPSKEFFLALAASQEGKLFITTYHNKVIGGCACVYTRQCLLMVCRSQAQEPCHPSPPHHGHLACHPVCPCPGMQALQLHGCRTALEAEPISRVSPYLRRQTHHQVSLVSLLSTLHQQPAALDIQGIKKRSFSRQHLAL